MFDQSRQAVAHAVNAAGLRNLFNAVCRDALDATQATRASIWYFEPNGSISCQHLIDRRTPNAPPGMVIGREHHADYLNAILTERVIAAEDARRHPATRCFAQGYFIDNDIHSLLDFLINDREGNPAAILCCEQTSAPRQWRERDLVALYGLAEFIAGTLQYQTGNAAQRALFEPDLPFYDDPLLLEVAIYWASKRSSRFAPHRDDISPIDLPRRLLPHLVIAELLHEPFDVRFRLVGSHMAEKFGRDFAGERINDVMRDDYAAYIRGLFRRVFDTAGPVYSESPFRWDHGGHGRTRRLMLPLTTDGSSVSQVMVLQVWPEGEAHHLPPSATPIKSSSLDRGILQSLLLPRLDRDGY
ncbi:PAS domain-containing protein [Ferrovibrio sp.]|uniref:PAS domain-containing protein n=1 Tax=Ferrovibrio sp. TaxID=1917215 RepID=UPI003D1294AB